MIKKISRRKATLSIALSLLPSVLTGCSPNRFSYDSNEKNEIVANGTINYSVLKECFFIEIENPDYDKIEYYIAERRSSGGLFNVREYYYYDDVSTGKRVFQRETNKNTYYKSDLDNNASSRLLNKELKVEDYLLSENFIKNAYTIDDVEKIFDAIKENEQDKKLVKE